MNEKQKNTIPIDDEEQSKRFVETASALIDGADDVLFRAALAKVTAQTTKTVHTAASPRQKKSGPKSGA